MASRVVMPKLSDTMEEGQILRWLKQEGDTVETGQTLAEVETDKATVEMEAYTNGIIRKLVAAPGDTVKIGALIAVIGGPDEDISAPARSRRRRGAGRRRRPPAAAPAPGRPRRPRRRPGRAGAARRGRARRRPSRALRASPLALRMAAEAGIDLGALQGSGPQGRVIKRDIEAALARRPQPRRRPAAPPAAARRATSQEVELSSMRRTIAKRLVQSKAPVPHFYLTVDVATDRAVGRLPGAARGEVPDLAQRHHHQGGGVGAAGATRRSTRRSRGDHVKQLLAGAHRHGRGARGRPDHAGHPRRRLEVARRDRGRGAGRWPTAPAAASCSRTSTPAPPSRSRTSA